MTPPQTWVLERAAASPRTGEPGAPLDPGRVPRWEQWQIHGRQLGTVTLAVIRREWVALLFGLSAVFAAITALVSVNAPERLWGEWASVSYAVAAVLVVVTRWRAATCTVLAALTRTRAATATVLAAVTRTRAATAAVLLSLAGALIAPLAWMASTGLAQPEVHVIVHSARMFVHSGTPYASPAALAAQHTWTAYDPYLPALIVFGTLRTLGTSVLTDPRIWFGLAFVVTFGAALRLARVRRPVWWTVLVTASPVVALPVAVGGDDLPVLGLMCLGLALAGRAVLDDAGAGRWRWAVTAGLALGLAAAMKATAWPAVAVVLVLLARRAGSRAAGWFTLAAAAVVAVTDGPVVAAHPAATVTNTILYPLGLTKAVSPAASQLPGHLLAGVGTWGHWAALVLMMLAGAGVAASMFIRPPKDAQGAGWRLVLGFTLLFGLAPASRVGYFVYPFGLAAWLLLARLAEARQAETGQAGDGPAGEWSAEARSAGGRSADPVPADRNTIPAAT
jgi:hypothetical protein